jgi:hypothetical protein
MGPFFINLGDFTEFLRYNFKHREWFLFLAKRFVSQLPFNPIEITVSNDRKALNIIDSER